jgi:hypothetical protein
MPDQPMGARGERRARTRDGAARAAPYPARCVSTTTSPYVPFCARLRSTGGRCYVRGLWARQAEHREDGAEFPFVRFRPPRFGSKLLAGGSDGVGDMRAALPHRLIGSSRGIAFGLAFELGVHGGTKEHGVGHEVQPEQ